MFASKKEAKRYMDLWLMQRSGDISGLQLQVPFDIVVHGIKICRYVADFVYQTDHGDTVVEDVKGVKTPTYNLKKKLMRAVHGISILET